MKEQRWSDGEAEGVYLNGRLSVYAKPSMTADDGTVAVGIEAPWIAELAQERDFAIAHDRQPYPTAHAYEQVCAARAKWQERAEAAESALNRPRSQWRWWR